MSCTFHSLNQYHSHMCFGPDHSLASIFGLLATLSEYPRSTELHQVHVKLVATTRRFEYKPVPWQVVNDLYLLGFSSKIARISSLPFGWTMRCHQSYLLVIMFYDAFDPQHHPQNFQVTCHLEELRDHAPRYSQVEVACRASCDLTVACSFKAQGKL